MKFSKGTIAAMALAVIFSVGLIAAAGNLSQPEEEILRGPDWAQDPQLGYETKLFDNSIVHTIDIQVREADWAHMKAEAMSKELIDGTVVIDGEEVHHVGVRPKGNSTLFFNSAKGWDRYSLVLEFDAFQESQRYHGLDRLALYNNMFDATCMKTWLSYEMMRDMGVPTPLCSFVALHLNGEYIGMYAASEVFSESFALRNFGYEYGQIYKPEHMDIGAIMTGELQNTKVNFAALASKEDGGSGFTIDSILQCSNDAVRLAYLGESFYDYEDIWRNTVFPIGVSDKERVVRAIRAINEGSQQEAEAVVDLDALARYFAVNTFVLNTDCYTTGMAHNYGIYEKDGVLTMLPWDYDVGLGNIGSEFGISSASAFINQPIDEPVMGTTVEERPMLKVLLESEEGRALYYQYLDELTETWIEKGRLQAEAEAMEELIRPWIAGEDPSLKIYSLAEHDNAVDSILQFAAYRGESVRGQLDGTIGRTAAEQAASPETLVDCSGYAPPDSGIMKVLLPQADEAEVSLDALLGVLPEACRNMHTSVNLLALFNMVDYGALLDMALEPAGEEEVIEAAAGTDNSSGAEEESSHDLDVGQLVMAFMPYPVVLAKYILTAIAVPAVLILGLRFVRRWRKKKGGVRRVL